MAANIAVVAAKVGLVDPVSAIVKSYKAEIAITAGLPVYVTATGGLGICDGNAAGMYQFRGISLGAAAIGQMVDVVQEGEIFGFTHTTNYDTRLYVSDTVGVISDTAGTKTNGNWSKFSTLILTSQL